MRLHHSPSHAERGLALVELALAMPLLLLLLVGLIEIGRFAYFGILVGNAARAGVQYGSQSLQKARDSSGMENAALSDGQNVRGLSVTSPPPSTICTCYNGATSTPVSCSQTTCPLAGYHRVVYVQVTATGAFSPILRYPGLPSNFSVTRTATMRVVAQ